MRTVIEVARDGTTPLRVFHWNRSDRMWTHPLEDRATCPNCQGASEAAPPEDA